MRRHALASLLAVVALAAAVLSFDALHGLARLCGFGPAFAPLLPVVIDAGAAAGSLAWLTQPLGRARTFGRALALALLVGSVAGNALGHGLAAYATRPAWWVVVAVSAVPPAVLGAVVHLLALVAQARSAAREAAADDPGVASWDEEAPDWWADATVVAVPAADGDDDAPPAGTDTVAHLIAQGAGRRRLARELGVSEHQARELLARHREGRAS